MQATVKYPQLAAVIAEIEKTGHTRAAIGRLSGRDGSAATRWAKGTHLPGWAAVKTLADALRAEQPDLSDKLLAAWHYYSDPVEPRPGSAVPDDVRQVIMKAPRDDQWKRDAIEALEAIARGTAGTGSSSPAPAGPEQRAV